MQLDELERLYGNKGKPSVSVLEGEVIEDDDDDDEDDDDNLYENLDVCAELLRQCRDFLDYVCDANKRVLGVGDRKLASEMSDAITAHLTVMETEEEIEESCDPCERARQKLEAMTPNDVDRLNRIMDCIHSHQSGLDV